MIIYTRMGWLVPAVWLAAIALASQIPPALLAQYGMGATRATMIFLLGAALSAPLVFMLGTLLNRDKMPRRIVRFGKEKIVNWGTHTFYMLPIEYWAMMIPVATVVFYAIFTLI